LEKLFTPCASVTKQYNLVYRPEGGDAVRLGRQQQAWWKVMAAYRRVDDMRADCMFVHRDQLRAQRSVSSMGKSLPSFIPYCGAKQPCGSQVHERILFAT